MFVHNYTCFTKPMLKLMKRTVSSAILILITALASLPVCAQYEFRTIDTSDGLPSNSVRAIIQDRHGLIWIGTGQGLCSFDGNNVNEEPFAPPVMSRYVNCMLLDHEGSIWLGTDDAVYRLNAPSNPILLTEEVVNCITDDSKGSIWIGTRARGVFRCFKDDTDGEWHQQQFADGQTVENIFVDRNGLLWVFCMDGTALNFDNLSGSMQPAGIRWPQGRPGRVVQTYQDPSGDIWLCTWDDGIYKLSQNSLDAQITVFTGAPGMNHVHSARSIEPYILVVGSDDGLARLDLLSGTIRTDGRKKFIYAIYDDAEFGLWVGSYFSGVHYRILNDYRRFITYPLSETGECIVSCFTQTPDGALWAGSDNMGVIRFDKETGQPMAQFLPDRNVHALLPWRGGLLAGSYSGGIDLLNYSTGSATRLVTESVYSLATDADDNLWFGTMNEIFRMHLPQGKPELMLSGVGLVTSAKVSQDGTVWFATENKGLLSYNPIEGTWRQYTRQDGVESQSINSLYISASGLLIAAGNEGISYLQPGMSRFTPVFPQGNPNVLYATSDMRNIWYTTSNGLYKYNTHDGNTEYFGGEAGLYDGGFITGSGFTSDDGRIWLGTYMGATSFHPGNIRINQYSPPAVLTGVTFRNRNRAGLIKPDLRMRPDDKLHETATPHRYNNVTFSYSALSYRVPSRNSYMIMLEGFDTEWIETGHSSTTYTNLPAGRYTFKVLSCNSDRVWSGSETTFEFTIRPRMMFSNLAILIYALLFILAGVQALHYFNYKVQELSQKKMDSFVREFEQTEKERRTMDFEKKMREVIARNLSNPDLSSEMLADSLYVSRSGLFAKVKEITGSTPHQLILDARLEEAARLLQEGTHTVHDVCVMVGFNSSNYFSRCFKQKYGCTPRDWNNK